MNTTQPSITIEQYIKTCKCRVKQEYWLYVIAITGLYLVAGIVLLMLDKAQAPNTLTGTGLIMWAVGFIVGWTDSQLLKNMFKQLRLPKQRWEAMAREVAKDDGVALVD